MSKDSSKDPSSDEVIHRKNWFRSSHKAGLGPPWLIILNVLLIFLLSQIFAAFIIQLALNLAGLRPDSLTTSAGAQFAYVLLAEGFAAGFVFYALKSRRLKLNIIGLGRRPQKQDLYKAGLGFLVFYGLLIVTAGILTQFYPDLNKGTQDVGFNDLRGNLDIFIALFALVLLPPIGEEILVRGYLFSGLAQRMRFFPAMIITSIIFGVAHLQTGSGPGVLWAAGINTFVLSVVLVYLRRSTDALYAGMLVHMVNNLIAFGIHFNT